MEAIRWGIIGCGDVTEVKSGPAFSKVPHSKLVAVMRRNAGKAEDYARRHGVLRWYTDAAALINDPEVNAVYVATPPSSHAAYAIEALRAGKPVYVEKPMSVNAAEAQRMLEASIETGLPLTVAHYRRQQPFFLKVRSLLQEQVLGRITGVTMEMLQPHHSDIIADTEDNWRIRPEVSGGGLFHDLAPHQLDLMLYFFGWPQSASGKALNSGRFYAAPDTVAGQIVFSNDVLFNGYWSFNAPEKKDRCTIMGEQGSIHFSIFSGREIVLQTKGGRQSFHFDALDHVQQPMIEQTVLYFLGKADNPCPAAEGVEVMRLIDAMTNSQ